MLEKIVRMPQEKLFNFIVSSFPKEQTVFHKGKYILVKGHSPALLVAHLDTVHHDNVTTVCYSDDRNIMMSPQGIGGDDRCGVYGILKAYNEAKEKPWLLFTCDEEVGGVGAREFVKELPLRKQLEQMKIIIELDRKGKNDAVYYDCYCPELEKYIESKGYHTDYGSYSDICDVAPVLGVAAVNLSSGYYNAHKTHEYINVKHLENTIKTVIEIVNEVDTLPQFIYEDGGWYSKYDSYYSWGYPTDYEFKTEKLTYEEQFYYEELAKVYNEDDIKDYCEERLCEDGDCFLDTLFDLWSEMMDEEEEK